MPPEPEGRELIVRATHVEAPAVEVPEFGEIEIDHGHGEPDYEPVFHAPEEEPEVVHPPHAPADLTPQGRYRAAVTDDPSFQWRLPKPKLLTRSSVEQARPDTAGQEQVAAGLLEALGHFGVAGEGRSARSTGPHITRYELRLAPGHQGRQGRQAQGRPRLRAGGDRHPHPRADPGQAGGGRRGAQRAGGEIVRLGDVYQEPPADWSPLAVWLGKDVAGHAIGADLAKMPHLLVAGTTGAGKSGAVNAMLASILLRATPHDVRLVLVDPKQVELNHYESIPHLLTPVITSPRMAANALQNLVREMEQRYGDRCRSRAPASLVELNRAPRASAASRRCPYILCVIDELADLMMVAPGRRRGLDHPPRAEGPRGRHPPRARHPVAAGRRDHRHDQGQRALADRLRRLLADRLARDPRPERRRVAARAGRHAVRAGRLDRRLQRIQGAYIDEAQIA